MPTQEQIEQFYPLWRWHLWEQGFGTYEQIEAAVENGTLHLWTCPKSDCDCKWTKNASPASVAQLIENDPALKEAFDIQRPKSFAAQPSTTPSVEGWQSIETAPKDKTRILLWWPYWAHDPIIGSWAYGRWISEHALDGEGPEPTHWMPLPAAPASSSVENDSD